MISGYELGQFLRILLWIFVPMVIISMLVTTWLHYRRKRRESDEMLLSIEGLSPGDGQDKAFLSLRMSSGLEGGSVEEEVIVDDEEEYKETVYKGILWMKDKYEQYRDMADQRYERLKEDLSRAEKKYDDLLASIVEVRVGDRREKLLSATAHAFVEKRAVQGPAAEEGPVDQVKVVETRPAPPVEIRPVTVNTVTAAEVERDSLRDLLAERNQQIVFLQRQLDQRIKDFHLAEHEGREARGQIQEVEEQAARTRQRQEEELDRIRHQLEDEIARGRRQLEEQKVESKHQLEEQGSTADRKLEEKLRMISDLEEQVHVLRQKIEELVDKLRNNSQLLLNIYQELDKSLRTTDVGPQP